MSERLLQGFLQGFEDMPHELDYWVGAPEIEGQIPPELTGTLFRNGPGRVRTPMGKVAQPFQADGMLVSMAFRDGKAFFRNRHISRVDDAPRQVCSFRPCTAPVHVRTVDLSSGTLPGMHG